MILEALWGWRRERRGLERTFVDNPAAWLVQMFGGRTSATGIPVNETSALQSPPVFSSVAGLSETIGSLPLLIYKRLAGGGKDVDPAHPLYERLHLQPNPEITTMTWREMGQAQAMLHGNAYAEIVRDGAGRVTEIWPIPSPRVRLERRGPQNSLTYLIRVSDRTMSAPGGPPIASNQDVSLRPDQVLHVRGLSLDGVEGLSRLVLHRESIGLTLALEEYGARFFGNDATPSGVLEHPNKVGDAKKLKESWEAAHQGLGQAHRIAVLEEGMKFHEISMTNEKAQFLNSRQFQVGEMGRVFRMPGVMIGHNDNTATYASAEQFFLAYVVHTVRPWTVRWDQALTLALLTPEERRTHFIEHKIDGLLRGDLASRYAAYAIGRQWGWLAADDIRELENLNPLPKGQGQTYLVPLNMMPTDQPAPAAPAPTAAPAARSDALAEAMAAILSDAAGRVVRREVEAVRKEAVRLAADPGAWRTWVEQFYAKHAAYVSEALHVSLATGRAYAQDHRAALLAEGLGILDRWEHEAPIGLVARVASLSGNGH